MGDKQLGPTVAGSWYPGQRAALERQIDALLSATEERPRAGRPLALVSPHAGLIYSGPIAASAYAGMQKLAGQIRRVVLLGPAHRVAFYGIAVPTVTSFSTPLGEVQLARDELDALCNIEGVGLSDQAHQFEHCLEVQLPFLQHCLGDFKLLPMLAGSCTQELVSQVLDAVWGGEETLILISSDLSHFHDYETARRLDRQTADSIMALKTPLPEGGACGHLGIEGLLPLIRSKGLKPVELDLRNSGDTCGDKSSVVGYGTFAFCRI